jgi:hypothetical protein
MSEEVISTRRASPQHYFRELLTPSHVDLLATIDEVGREWDRLVYSGRLRRALRGRGRVHFSPQGYAPVVGSASSAALSTTLWHVAVLRRHPRVRRNLAAIVFLERFEAAVDEELGRRAPHPAG